MIFYLSENKIENLCLEYNLDGQTFKNYLKKVFQGVELETGGVTLHFDHKQLDNSENYQYILKKLDKREIFHDLSVVKNIVPYHYYSMAGSLKYADGECPKKFQQGDILNYIVRPFDRHLINEIMIQCSVENFPIMGKERSGDTFVYRQTSLATVMSSVSSAAMVVFLTEVSDGHARGTPLIIQI